MDGRARSRWCINKPQKTCKNAMKWTYKLSVKTACSTAVLAFLQCSRDSVNVNSLTSKLHGQTPLLLIHSGTCTVGSLLNRPVENCYTNMHGISSVRNRNLAAYVREGLYMGCACATKACFLCNLCKFALHAAGAVSV